MTPSPKGMENPFETPLPEGDLYPEDEVSKVKDARDAWKKLEKLDRVLNRMVEPISQIPDIREKVVGVVERVARVEERLATTKEQVADLDEQTRRPHDCFQVDNIERIEVAELSLRKDVEDDTRKLIQTCAALDSVTEKVTKIETNVKAAKEIRRSNHYFWVAIAVGFLTTAGASIWYMRGVSAEIALESQARSAQFDQVKTVLNKVSEQTDSAPVVQQIKQLQTSVDQANGEYNDLCKGMPEDQKARVRQALLGKELPVSCAKVGTFVPSS
jgi:hypothetical protein